MQTEFLLFKSFRTEAEANYIKGIIESAGVTILIEYNQSELSDTFANGEHVAPYQLLLESKDFEIANNLLTQEAEKSINNIPDDYYLFEFDNSELYSILLKPDEWGEFDYVLAKKILADRGQETNEDLIKSLRQERLSELRQPDKESTSWIYVAYTIAVLGGFLGVILGYQFWKGKKTLPNGERVFRYSPKTQQHGKRIFTLGIITFILWTVFIANERLRTLIY